MQIAKWGNSLAVRLPASLVKEMGLKEGDAVELRHLSGNQFEVIREKSRAEIIEEMHERMKGWAPAGFKFDRDEANER